MGFSRSRRAGTVGLSEKSIADRAISKRSCCSMTSSSGRLRAMMSPKAACVEAFIADRRRAAPFGSSPASEVTFEPWNSSFSAPSKPTRRTCLLAPIAIDLNIGPEQAANSRDPSASFFSCSYDSLRHFNRTGAATCAFSLDRPSKSPAHRRSERRTCRCPCSDRVAGS